MNSNEFRKYAIGALCGLSVNTTSVLSTAAPGDFTASFHNRTTNVAVIGISHGFAINVKLSSTSRRHMEYPTYDFDDLLAIRAADFQVLGPSGNATNKIQKRQIDEYATLLDKYAADVLSGDFVIFPLLAQAIEKRIEEQRRQALSSKQSPDVDDKARRRWK